MNRPERRNALTADLLDRVREAMQIADGEPETRAVVLTGAGGFFSSGADLRGESLGAERVLRDHYEPLITTMVGLGVPIVAAIDGFAVGAGASIALACDFRVMASDAFVYVPFAGIGLIPDAGLTWLLPRTVGAARAAQICMLDERVDAATAHAWGIATAVAETTSSLDRALELATALAARSSSLGAVKAALATSWTRDLADHMVFEREVQQRLQALPDYPAAVAAFREHRPPTFGPRPVPGPTHRGELT
ncbi:2-(1,2-epoxy-1,2-dihydrophenyl)acetyl-CoA isomerase [Aeromicrobium fastidiosum]|nr:2-(1,2-epoxy-1,2-dihydrophenyl)acetyl-CoA isomerase [Aeromicrobium fastidiosum]